MRNWAPKRGLPPAGPALTPGLKGILGPGDIEPGERTDRMEKRGLSGSKFLSGKWIPNARFIRPRPAYTHVSALRRLQRWE